MYRYVKRIADLVISGLGILVLSPLYLIIALYVAAFMGFPVMFSQNRIGKGGQVFRMYKFRSMTDDRDGDGNLLPESERLTKAGVLLRSSSLDELPELWSVFKGDMSLIGPRPLPDYYSPFFYDKEWHRHDVRGGLIPCDGLCGETTPSWETQLEYDMYYADNMSFSLDCRVLWKTFRIVVNRIGEEYGTCERPHLSAYRKDLVGKGESLHHDN